MHQNLLMYLFMLHKQQRSTKSLYTCRGSSSHLGTLTNSTLSLTGYSHIARLIRQNLNLLDSQQYGLMDAWIFARLCTISAAIRALAILLAALSGALCSTRLLTLVTTSTVMSSLQGQAVVRSKIRIPVR